MPEPVVAVYDATVAGPAGPARPRQAISQRHAEILLVLATSPAGRSATELATAIRSIRRSKS